MKRPYRSPLRWTLLPLMIVAMGCGGPEPESDGPELIIETSYGRVEGAAVDDGRGPAGDVLVFRGIPYAAPPVGELRWRPPEPPASWEGVRSAHESGAPCWQGITPDTSIYSRGELDRSEDCLYLDLWTAAEAPGGGNPRPVMVWFHGGSHEMGHGSSLIFDGAALARKGVVLVSINYRLGSFGFLAHAGLSAESEHGSSGNYGLLDKIAALEWVQANAYVFGNVDLVGINWEDRDHEIADLLSSYWTNFAKTGDPNGEGLAQWPRYDADGDLALVVGDEVGAQAGVLKQKLDALDRALAGGG